MSARNRRKLNTMVKDFSEFIYCFDNFCLIIGLLLFFHKPIISHF